jgi:hypothetical protein
MKSIIAILIMAGIAMGKVANIDGKDNKVSVNWGPLIGYLAGDGYIPLRINYERYWDHNISLGGYLGMSLIDEKGDRPNYELAVGARKYFWGHFQRFSIGLLPFANIRNRDFGAKTVDAGIPFLVGYSWQWSRVFTGIETGFGPGISTSIIEGQRNSSAFETIAEGALKIGFVF